MPRDELPEHIPTLAELFVTCGTDYHLSLDLKQAGIGDAVIAVVRDHAPDLLARLWLCHPKVDELAALRGADAVREAGQLDPLAHMRNGAERRAANLAELGIDAVNLHHTEWTGGLVTLFHRFERIAFGWDMQFEHMLRPAIRMGIDGVFSDHVDVMVDAIAAEPGDQWPNSGTTCRRCGRRWRSCSPGYRSPPCSRGSASSTPSPPPSPAAGSGTRRSPRCGSSPR